MSSPNGVARSAPVPPDADPIRFDANEPPILIALVATEEEFDWKAEFDRRSTSVRAAARLPRAQKVFDEFGVRPTYLCDYPIASQAESFEPLREVLSGGRAELGAHLHPWVTPPFDEALTRAHSFPGNLAPELERQKLVSLVEVLERNVGRRPRVYQAGRYGFGPNTADTIAELGFEVDCSTSPAFDYSSEGGPNFVRASIDLHWHPRRKELLCIPVTGAFVGFFGERAPSWYGFATRPWIVWTRLPALFARMRAVERMRLSPEGHSFDDLRRLTLALRARGTAVFSFGFHSPTLMPGCTSYVSSEAELERFFDCCRRYFEFFQRELRGRIMTPSELRRHLLERRARVAR